LKHVFKTDTNRRPPVRLLLSGFGQVRPEAGEARP
jgi:hypothetical protein